MSFYLYRESQNPESQEAVILKYSMDLEVLHSYALKQGAKLRPALKDYFRRVDGTSFSIGTTETEHKKYLADEAIISAFFSKKASEGKDLPTIPNTPIVVGDAVWLLILLAIFNFVIIPAWNSHVQPELNKIDAQQERIRK